MRLGGAATRPRPRPCCGGRIYYATVIPSSFLRARNKFTNAHLANSRFAFFAIAR
jgi:hypothetical protein